MRCIAAARIARLFVIVALMNSSLLGCAGKHIPPASEAGPRLSGHVRNGAAVLDCGSECAKAWRSKRAALSNQAVTTRKPQEKPAATSTALSSASDDGIAQSPILPAEAPGTDRPWIDPPPVTR